MLNRKPLPAGQCGKPCTHPAICESHGCGRELQRAASVAALVASSQRPIGRAVMATPASFTARVAPPMHTPERDAMRPATTTAAESEYMGRVAALGCVICRLMGNGPTPAQVHHVRTGQGAAQRAGNYCVIPLCEPHHNGPTGIHGDRSALRLLKVTEMDLLDITIGEAACLST